MSKKVRYALGAIGAVPALGLLTPPATGAAAAAPTASQSVKTVSLAHHSAVPEAASCLASRVHSVDTFGVLLRFWSKPEGSRTCIGTIHVSHPAGGHGSKVQGFVGNDNGTFCNHTAGGHDANFVCRRIFVRAGLFVEGTWWSSGIIVGNANLAYPF